MAEGDREHWDARYRDTPVPVHGLEHWLTTSVELPMTGAALDVATGTGAVACFMAARGLDVLALDVSPVALSLAQQAARALGLDLRTCALDLECEPLPRGPFVLISCERYLQRALWPELASRLSPGGLLALQIATVSNLERHAHPTRRWLVERGELARVFGAMPSLEILYTSEAWFDAQHCARIVARRRV